MMADLQPGEKVLLEGRAGYEVSWNRGNLTLTDRRLIWERRFSIDPFGEHEMAMPVNAIHSAEARGDAIVLQTDSGEVFLFVQLLPLSMLTGNRRTREWLRELKRVIQAAKREAPAS